MPPALSEQDNRRVAKLLEFAENAKAGEVYTIPPALRTDEFERQYLAELFETTKWFVEKRSAGILSVTWLGKHFRAIFAHENNLDI